MKCQFCDTVNDFNDDSLVREHDPFIGITFNSCQDCLCRFLAYKYSLPEYVLHSNLCEVLEVYKTVTMHGSDIERHLPLLEEKIYTVNAQLIKACADTVQKLRIWIKGSTK